MSLPRHAPANVVQFSTCRRPGRAGLRRLILDIIRSLAEDVRGSLPSTEAEVGLFVAGMAWGLLIFMLLLVGVTCAYAWATGLRLS